MMMMEIPTAIRGATGSGEEILYRGIRDGSRTSDYQWWTPCPAYAAEYGETILEGALAEDAEILDITGDDALTDDGEYAGEKLEAILPGLPAACGLDVDDVVGRDRLWDLAYGDHSKLASLLKVSGFDGMRWYEGNGDQEALLLIVR